MTKGEGLQSWLTPLSDNQVGNIDFHHQVYVFLAQTVDVTLFTCDTQLAIEGTGKLKQC